MSRNIRIYGERLAIPKTDYGSWCILAGTPVALLPATDANSQAIQTALEVPGAQHAYTTVNVVQEPPESPKQTGTGRIPPGGLFIPLASSIDAGIQAMRTALIAQELQQMDTDNSITTDQHTPPPSPQQTSGVPQGTSKERLTTENSAKEPTHHDVHVNVLSASDRQCQSPDSEYNPGDCLTGGPVYIPTTRTPYLPQVVDVDRRTCYDAMGADPRLAFCGAPSTDINSGVAHLLRRIRRTVITNGRRSVQAYFPDNCACLIKREEATLPNGTTYKLTTTWVKEPSESIGVPEEQ